MESKVINPISDKKITVHGKLFNYLINNGYEYINNQLVKIEEKEYESEESDISDESDESKSIDYGSESEEYEEDEEEYENKNKNKNEEEEEYEAYDYEEAQPIYGGSKRPGFEHRDIEIHSYDLPFVRCLECNKPISTLHSRYNELIKEGYTPIEIYSKLNLNRPCCRMHITNPQKHYLFEGEPQPIKKTKLSKNPYFKETLIKNPVKIIRLYKGDQFEGIKEKVTFGPHEEYVKYEKFTSPELLRKEEIGKGKYYISYAK